MSFSRIPIRWRLTLAFAVTMAVVLAAAGLFVYLRFRAESTRTLDVEINAEAAALVPRLQKPGSDLQTVVAQPLFHGHESFVEVVDARDRVLAATAGLDDIALLNAALAAQAMERTEFVTLGATRPLPEGSRLLAQPVRSPTYGVVLLIVGTSLDQQSSALSHLGLVLAIAGPLALILASLAGYSVASAALRPVELMRRRAAAVSAGQPDVRLPVPAAKDELRALAGTLNEMIDRLEQSFARERAFVANASHELRTPLTTLKTELELALRRDRPAPELQEALRSSRDEVDRLSALAEDLLVLARADDGVLPIRRREFAVVELLHSVRDRFDPRHERIGVDAPASLRLEADPDRLDQALANLVDNALQYSSGPVSVSAREDPDGAVEIHVEDVGPGFPDGFIEHAFERFSRGGAGRGGRGSGLGLSIVQMIARAHGSETHAVNRDDGGADVWIVIPQPADR